MPVEARSAIRMGGLLPEVTEGVEDRSGGSLPTQSNHPWPEALWADVLRIAEQ
jgi:hypothetical protein